MNSKIMDAFRYIVPFSKYAFPRIETDEASINVSEDLSNSSFLTEKINMEIIKMDQH